MFHQRCFLVCPGLRSHHPRFDPHHRRFDPLHRRFDPHHRRFDHYHSRFDPHRRKFDPTILDSIPTIADSIPTCFSLSCARTFDVVFNAFPYFNSCSPSLKRVQLELGGKSPLIIFADCDMERAVRQVNLLYWSYFQLVQVQFYVTIVFVFRVSWLAFSTKERIALPRVRIEI